VKKLVKKHFWDMGVENSLSTDNNPVLPEDAAIFLKSISIFLVLKPMA